MKSPEAFTHQKLESYKMPEFKFVPYSSINVAQLKNYMADTKLKARLKQLGKNMTVSSSGGYNDFYLKFLQESFDIQIRKTHAFFAYAVLAIDFLNRQTTDCFFELPSHESSLLQCVGKSIVCMRDQSGGSQAASAGSALLQLQGQAISVPAGEHKVGRGVPPGGRAQELLQAGRQQHWRLHVLGISRAMLQSEVGVDEAADELQVPA